MFSVCARTAADISYALANLHLLKHRFCLPQLRRMDMEARSFSQEKSQQLMRKVKEYKADLKKITEDSRQAQGAASGILPAAGS